VGRWKVGARGQAGVAACGAEASRPAAGQSRREELAAAWRKEGSVVSEQWREVVDFSYLTQSTGPIEWQGCRRRQTSKTKSNKLLIIGTEVPVENTVLQDDCT
jgi:hypothetical protein